VGPLTDHQIWFIWALNLLAQNFMFTFVSRARNSGSLKRHVVAAIGSNGVWILQFQIMLGPMMDYLNGKHGPLAQVGVGAFYTFFTVAGSVVAHHWSLKNEAGNSAVGANKRYVQITREEWDDVQRRLVRSPRTCPIYETCPVTLGWPGFTDKIDQLAEQVRGTRDKIAKMRDNLLKEA